MRNTLLILLAAILGLAVPKQVLAQKVIHKPTLHSSLTLKEIVNIYSLVQLPDLDEYFSAHGWIFSKSQPTPAVNQVVYTHKISSENTETIDLFLCKENDSEFCIKPQFHNQNGEYLFQIMYKVQKATFDNLQAEMRKISNPTSSNVGDDYISSSYRYENVRFAFRVQHKQDSDNVYSIIFGDVESSMKSK